MDQPTKGTLYSGYEGKILVHAMEDSGQDHVGSNWSVVMADVNLHMQVGTPKQFKSWPVDQATPAVAGVLNMWVKGSVVGADADDE
jgi:hypothetical protein